MTNECALGTSSSTGREEQQARIVFVDRCVREIAAGGVGDEFVEVRFEGDDLSPYFTVEFGEALTAALVD